MMEEKANLKINRVVAAVVGGLLVFLIMNFGVVGAANARVADLQKQLEASAFGAGRILDEAKALMAAKQYREAGVSLASLMERHPSSIEATEGRSLAIDLAAAQAKEDAAWAVAVVGIRGKWVAAEAARLRAQAESELQASIDRNWERAVDGLRADWARL